MRLKDDGVARGPVTSNSLVDRSQCLTDGGAMLLVKLGTHPQLTEVVVQLQQLLPNTKLFGIRTSDTPPLSNLEYVANENELLLAAYAEWWEKHLFVEPELYLKVLPHEGQLLRMTQRAVDHNPFTIKKPQFPTEKDIEKLEGRRQLLLRQVAFWDAVLRRNKISAVVSQNLPHNFWDAVLHVVAEARGVPYLCFHEVRPFLGSLYIYEHPSEMGNLGFGRSLIELAAHDYGELSSSIARSEVMLSQISSTGLRNTREAGKKSRSNLRVKLHALSVGWRFVVPVIVNSLRRRISAHRSRQEKSECYWKSSIPARYFLIELQPPSNATSLTKGMMYGDARELLAQLAHNLPSGYSLVVKESSRHHMQSFPRRENFWRQIANLPSVVLPNPEVETDSLLKNATGLIEVGYSTLVLQALYVGTSVLILGNTHLPNLPGLYRVSVEDDIADVLESMVNEIPTRIESEANLMHSLTRWSDETRAATLEGALSSFPKDVANEAEYRQRVVRNVAKVVASWYSRKVLQQEVVK
jgi:hypothetical protein